MRTFTRVAVLAATAAVVAGCGGSSNPGGVARGVTGPGSPSASKTLLASVRTTAAAKSAHVSLTVSASGLGAGAFSLTGDGAIDFSNGDSQLTMHVGGATPLLPGGIEERTVNHVVYVELPSVTGNVQWLAVDAGKVGSSSTLLPGLGESDPTQFLASLETISDTVTKAGTDEIRGVDTTHYRATLDLGKALDQANVPPALRGAEKQFSGANGAQMPTIPVDVWLDGNGYVRRISLDLDLAALGGNGLGGTGPSGSGPAGSSPGVTVSIDFYDFGTPVNVQAPPANEISPLKNLGINGGGAIDAPASSSASVSAS